MPLMEKRYAEALVGISAEDGAIGEYRQDFRSVTDIFNTQPDFKFFLLNPEIKPGIKKETVKKLFTGRVRDKLVNYLMLLIDKGRIRFLPGIFEEFIKLADKAENVLIITIFSAEPLLEEQVNKIKEKYRKIHNADSVRASVGIDRSLIGGVKMIIGDKVTDATLKGKLESLKEALVK